MSENVLEKKNEKKVLKNPKQTIYSYALTCYTKLNKNENSLKKKLYIKLVKSFKKSFNDIIGENRNFFMEKYFFISQKKVFLRCIFKKI